MWEVSDTTLIDFLESGDVVNVFGEIVHVKRIDLTDDENVVIYGVDDEWGEDNTWEYPAGHYIELMILA